MGYFLVYLIIGLFVALLFIQLYFRIRVLKVYRRLVKNEVQFDTSHIMSKKKMEEEVLPRYPKHKDDIIKFVKEMRFSLQIASLLIVLIMVAGLILRT
ncbi:MAG: hypothetical protein P1U56_08355 [Saprospiraceae bacterium]|nr:hypothetical protein [Saprospiraceae bacterium]